MKIQSLFVLKTHFLGHPLGAKNACPSNSRKNLSDCSPDADDDFANTYSYTFFNKLIYCGKLLEKYKRAKT